MPIDEAGEITAQALHKELAQRDRPVSVTQLGRWRGQGLVPKARKRGAGRGSVVSYPASSVAHVARAAELVITRKLSIRDARWQLWCEGYPIAPCRWRPEIDAAAERIDRAIADLNERRDGSERAWTTLVRNVFSTPAAPSPFKRMRKDIGAQRFPEFLDMVVDMATGLFTAVSSQPERKHDGPKRTEEFDDFKSAQRILDKALGFRHARQVRAGVVPELIGGDYSGVLMGLAEAIGRGPLRPRIAGMPDAALQQSARQFSQLAAVLTRAAEMACEANFRDGLGFERAASIIATTDTPSSAMLVAFWAVYQVDPKIRAQAADLLRVLVEIQGGQVLSPGTSEG